MLDLVTGHEVMNKVSVLLGLGDGRFAAQSTYAAGGFPRSVSLGDLNGDGVLDLVTANSGSDNVSVLLGRSVSLADAADLVVSSLSVSQASVHAASQATVTFSIVNQGSVAAPATPARIRLALGTTITSSDPLLAQVTVGALDAGQSQTLSQVVTIPSWIEPGEYYIGVTANATGPVEESNPNNNQRVIPITVDSGVAVLIKTTPSGLVYPIGRSEPYASNMPGWLAGADGTGYHDGYYHLGQDMEAQVADSVYAIAGGEIVYVSSGGWGAGNYGVLVQHRLDNGQEFLALYGHVRPIDAELRHSGPVQTPIPVSPGEVFATVGPTKDTHLHFGICPGITWPISNWGRMPLEAWPATNGFVDPMEWITTYTPGDPVPEIPAETPRTPRRLTAEAISPSTVGMSWQPGSANAQGFLIERRSSTEETWQQMADIGANVTSFRDADLTPDTTYFYRLLAYNIMGSSDWTREASLITTLDSLRPEIHSIEPSPPMATGSPQPFTIYGKNLEDAKVNLYYLDGTEDGEEFLDRDVRSNPSDTHITIDPNFGVIPGYWRVEVVNAGYASVHSFEVKPMESLETLLDFLEKDPGFDSSDDVQLRQIAYMLATVRGETSTYQPIEEDEDLWLGQRYAKVDPETGHQYYGRGYIQLTRKYNYGIFSFAEGDSSTGTFKGYLNEFLGSLGMSPRTALDLVWNPELAMNPEIAYAIMAYGMKNGIFRSTHSLEKYINDDGIDYIGARDIIQAVEYWKDLDPEEYVEQLTIAIQIAGYAEQFELWLNGSLGELADWSISGSGTVGTSVRSPETGSHWAILTTASPIMMYQAITTPDSSFDLSFDYQFLTTTGTLDVLLDSVVLGTIRAPVAIPDEPSTFNLIVNDPSLFSLENAVLTFRFDGPTDSQILLSNVFLTTVLVNDAPTVALTNNITSLAENTDTSSRTRVADVVVTDDTLGTHVMSLSGADAPMFEIDGMALYLKAGIALNHATHPQLDVTVEVDDTTIGSTPDDTATLSIEILDTTPPAVTAHALLTNDGTPALSGTVDDADAQVQITVDWQSYAAVNQGNGTWLLPDHTMVAVFADGTYDIEVSAIDDAGNVGTDTTTDELVIDTVAPAVTVDGLFTNDTTPELTGTVDDPSAVVKVTIAGNTYTAVNDGSGIWTLPDDALAPALADGIYDVAASAGDLAGNTGHDGSLDELTIDTVAPVLLKWDIPEDIGIDDALTSDTTPTLVFVFSEAVLGDQSDVTCRDPHQNIVSGDILSGWSTDTLTVRMAKPLVLDGQYTVTLQATSTIRDAAGNALNGGMDEVVLFVLDTVAPEVSVDALTTNDTTPELTGNVDDPDADVAVEVGGNVYIATNNGDGTWTLTDNVIVPQLAGGFYDIAVQATDLAGNVGTDSTTDELTVLELVDPLVDITVGRVRYDFWTRQSYVDVTVTNTSTVSLDPPIWLVVADISNPGVALSDPDGQTESGDDYIDLTEELSGGSFSPGESVSVRLYFNNTSGGFLGFLQSFTFTTHVWAIPSVPSYPTPPDRVDHLVNVSTGRIHSDFWSRQSYVDVRITNNSSTPIGGPVWLVVSYISDSAVTLINHTGQTESGDRYIDLTSQLGDDQLYPGESISVQVFFSGGFGGNFTFSTQVLGTALDPVQPVIPNPIDDLVDISMNGIRYDFWSGHSYMDVTITNTSDTPFDQPVWLVISDISNPLITVTNSDGLTESGDYYLNLTSLLGDMKLLPGESISTRIYFGGGFAWRLKLKLSVWGVII